ncbi:MAG: restriction endonuclease subunit S [Verrucomicrobia bacterium]|nr:restriction endonuclease subunit S [Verrucomicrobiota bacterium]
MKVEPEKLYQEIGIYCFGRGIFHKTPRTGFEVGDKDLFLMKQGDFILQVTFAWEGAIAIVSAAEDGMYGSTRYPTFRVDERRCVPQFLLNYFKTERGLQQLVKICPGSAGRNRVLSIKRIPEVQVPLPPLAEQRQVVARIEELAAQIHEARTLREQAAEEAEGLLVAMAHRGDLDQTAKENAGWKRKRLADLMQFVDDSHKVEPARSYPNLGIYSFGRGLFHKPPIDGLATSATALRRVRAGQFIYSRLFAFEGAYGRVTSEFDGAFVSQEYPTFDCDPQQVCSEFLAAYFKPAHLWKAVAAGSKGLGDRRQRVQPAQLLKHELWLPPIAWQNRLGEVQVEVDALKRLQAETAAELDALLPALLDRAFKGGL